MKRLATFLKYLRGRPAHERRILAVTTYVTAAVVVLAFWVESFRASLDLASHTPASPDIREESPRTPLGGLITPFQSLKNILANALGDFRKLEREANHLSRELTASGGEESFAPNASLPPHPSVATSTLSDAPREPPSLPAGAAEILAAASPQLPYARTLLSGLVTPSHETTKQAPEARSPLRETVTRIVRRNLSELRQTARDLYQYLTE